MSRTNPQIFTRAIREGVANAALIQLNQLVTVSETHEATARTVGYGWVVSHRSGGRCAGKGFRSAGGFRSP